MTKKLVFTKSFPELKSQLISLAGEWDESNPTRKVFHLNGGIMNWFESTGTIQFQGKDSARDALRERVQSLLYPNEFPAITVAPAATKQPDATIPHAEPAATNKPDEAKEYLEGAFTNSELIFGIVSAVGTEATRIITPLKDKIQLFGYKVHEIKVSELLGQQNGTEYARIKGLMQKGDELRQRSGKNSVLAAGASDRIKTLRATKSSKSAYIVNSLKHPEEVEFLRRVYGEGFFVLGIHADKKRRLHYLVNDKGLTDSEAEELTRIDEDEFVPHGQRTRDTFHLADFFMNLGKNDDEVKSTLERFLELIFSNPYKNPTFDEFAMFMAFCSSLRSGDLSRQVGAILARNKQIIATGANECPQFGGGHYWAALDPTTGEINDRAQGKDYKWEYDSNRAEQIEIIQNITERISGISGMSPEQLRRIEGILNESRIRDLTEFGRVAHAEMEALLSCARAGIPTTGSTIYCTTFPCHNCAKHIIAAGVEKVVYVEPYPKSKALELHSDSIELQSTTEASSSRSKVLFEPFTGVGARRFLDLFSMTLGTGSKLRRKDSDGNVIAWSRETGKARIPMVPASYIELEKAASELFRLYTNRPTSYA